MFFLILKVFLLSYVLTFELNFLGQISIFQSVLSWLLLRSPDSFGRSFFRVKPPTLLLLLPHFDHLQAQGPLIVLMLKELSDILPLFHLRFTLIFVLFADCNIELVLFIFMSFLVIGPLTYLFLGISDGIFCSKH